MCAHIAMIQIWAQIAFKKHCFKYVTYMNTEKCLVVSECSSDCNVHTVQVN